MVVGCWWFLCWFIENMSTTYRPGSWQSFFTLGSFAHHPLCLCGCMYTCMHEHVEVRVWCWVSSSMARYLIFWDQGCHWTWDLLIWLHLEPRHLCLHLPALPSFFFFFFNLGAGDWTQVLMLVRTESSQHPFYLELDYMCLGWLSACQENG